MLILVLGIGYSVLSTTLHIGGNVDVYEYLKPTLYNVLKKEALEICAVDVEMHPVEKQLWDATLLNTRNCLYFLKNG